MVVESEHVVLRGTVAETQCVGDPAGAEDVEDGDLFGESDSVPQWQGDGGEQNPQLPGPCGDGSRQDQWRRQVPVLGAMVLGQDGQYRTARFRP